MSGQNAGQFHESHDSHAQPGNARAVEGSCDIGREPGIQANDAWQGRCSVAPMNVRVIHFLDFFTNFLVAFFLGAGFLVAFFFLGPVGFATQAVSSSRMMGNFFLELFFDGILRLVGWPRCSLQRGCGKVITPVSTVGAVLTRLGGVNALWYFVNQQFSECPHRSLLPNLRIPLRAL